MEGGHSLGGGLLGRDSLRYLSFFGGLRLSGNFGRRSSAGLKSSNLPLGTSLSASLAQNKPISDDIHKRRVQVIFEGESST